MKAKKAMKIRKVPLIVVLTFRNLRVFTVVRNLISVRNAGKVSILPHSSVTIRSCI